MAAITIDGTDLRVTLERNEKFWGWLGDLRVPLESISEVAVVPNGRRVVRGLRAPGLGGPQRLIGTWRARNNKQYVCVRRDQPAVKLKLRDQSYDTVLIGLNDAEMVADEIRAVVHG